MDEVTVCVGFGDGLEVGGAVDGPAEASVLGSAVALVVVLALLTTSGWSAFRLLSSSTANAPMAAAVPTTAAPTV